MIGTGWTLGARLQRLLPVLYSEIWYSGSGWFWANMAMAASKAWIVLIALGDLEIRSASSLFCCTFCLILARASSRCACNEHIGGHGPGDQNHNGVLFEFL